MKIKMKMKNHPLLGKLTFGTVLGMAAIIGLAGCHHRDYHGHGDWHSEKHMEKRAEWLEEKLEDELALRPEQMEDMKALSSSFQSLGRARAERMKTTAMEAHTELKKETPDPDVVADLIKAQIQDNSSQKAMEDLVDQAAAFYKTLDPEQQKKFRKLVSKKINRHF